MRCGVGVSFRGVEGVVVCGVGSLVWRCDAGVWLRGVWGA